MSISTKRRRKIIVRDRAYVWYVAEDDDSAYDVLNIVSDDKYLILSCPLKTGTDYVISKGRIFQKKEIHSGWSRFLLPFSIPDAVTPKLVEQIIVWATESTDAVPINAGEVSL